MDMFQVCGCLGARSAEEKVPRGRYSSPAEDDSGWVRFETGGLVGHRV